MGLILVISAQSDMPLISAATKICLGNFQLHLNGVAETPFTRMAYGMLLCPMWILAENPCQNLCQTQPMWTGSKCLCGGPIIWNLQQSVDRGLMSPYCSLDPGCKPQNKMEESQPCMCAASPLPSIKSYGNCWAVFRTFWESGACLKVSFSLAVL